MRPYVEEALAQEDSIGNVRDFTRSRKAQSFSGGALVPAGKRNLSFSRVL